VRELASDILILGSGGAGLFAALHAHKSAPEASITVAVKGLLGKCGCTRMVQGGYNVALAREDSVERHFMDTIVGGAWLCDQELAWKLVTLAVERIRELENELGCFFDRNPDGTVHQKAFAGQTFDRTVHKGDLTGIEIINRLAEQVWARNIGRLEEHRAVELIRSAAASTCWCARRRCCSPPAAGRPCTSTTRLPATRPATGSPWRCAPGCRCATWRWCSSIPPGCWPARTPA
jgi:fumarate reductase flavoprotein subunit